MLLDCIVVCTFLYAIYNICYILLVATDLAVLPDERIINGHQPDVDDCGPSENRDDEADAMLEESPSGT